MIIVTGTGRSGTSMVAHLYKELGFDPGGDWLARDRAGFEAREIVDVNRVIEKHLGMGALGGRKRRSTAETVRRSLRRLRKGRLRRAGLETPLVWDRLEPVSARHGARLRELARAHAIAKDPRFCSTLGVWARAGAEIEHVLVLVRPLDAVTRSLAASAKSGRASDDAVRNALVYRLGLCMSTLHEFGIDHRVLTFPDFVQRPETLFDAMRFPEPVSQAQFLAAFERVAQPDMITELRDASRQRSGAVPRPHAR